MTTGGLTAARYRDVFAVGEFRALFAAHLLSIIGDQLARVALAVLVFDRTGSPALAALTYALTFIPELAGGPLLAGLGDRYPRRTLMVASDLLRAALVALMAVPDMPIWALALLLVAVQLAGAPFKAARAAILPTILPDDRFDVGSGVMFMTLNVGMLGGYSLGAPLVAAAGTSGALLLDAATFAVSAAFIRTGIGPHPPAGPTTSDVAVTASGTFRATSQMVWRDRRLRYLVAMACLAGFYAVPVGLAVPYAAQIGESTATVGLLLAAHPAGSAVGAILMTRLVPPRWRLRLLGPLAVATCAILLPTALAPGLAVTVLLWTLCGVLSGYDAVSVATFTRMVPDHNRGQAYGLASATLRAAEGLGIAVAGVVAQVSSPAAAITVFAAVGVIAASGTALGWHRASTNPSRPPTQPPTVEPRVLVRQ